MPFWETLLAGGIKGAAEGLGSLFVSIRTAITGDTPLTAEQKAALQEQMNAMEAAMQKAALDFDTAQMTGQVEINKIEAASPSFFKSGWRPAVGWVCVSGLCLTFLVRPLLPWSTQVAANVFGMTSAIPPIPEIPMGDLITLLVGMLGLGTMRTVERLQGKA